MLVASNIRSLARIPVQQIFCDNCSVHIKKGLQEITGIANVRLYPKESLVCFNFMTANTLSTALNFLLTIGFTEKGDKTFEEQFSLLSCGCQKEN